MSCLMSVKNFWQIFVPYWQNLITSVPIQTKQIAVPMYFFRDMLPLFSLSPMSPDSGSYRPEMIVRLFSLPSLVPCPQPSASCWTRCACTWGHHRNLNPSPCLAGTAHLVHTKKEDIYNTNIVNVFGSESVCLAEYSFR